MKEVGRCGRRAVAGEVWPQTGLAYLAAVVEAEGHVARVIDAMASEMSVDDVVAAVREWRPDVIVANTTTPTFSNDAEVLGRLRDVSDALLAFTGTHVSALPGEALEQSVADLIFVNEAEETLAEVLSAVAESGVEEARSNPSLVFANQLAVAWRFPDGSTWVAEPHADLAELDSYPLPARRLLPNDRYRMPFFAGESFATVIPTRGCPHACSFCRAGTVWGRTIRVRSVDNVMAELRQVVEELSIRNVVFMTDSLTLNHDWAMELFGAIELSGLGLRWICNSRVDAVDLELLQAMKRAGCEMISYGVESGDAGILRETRKGITLDQARKALALTRQARLTSMAYFIIGLPGETWESVRASIRFAKSIRPDYVNFHVATPFPGTRLCKQAKEEGWLTTEDWSEFEEEGSAVMVAGDLSAEELVAAQRQAMRAFYLRPSRLVQELFAVRSWADLTTRLRAGWRMVATLFGKGSK